jgi:hypothetical protein
VGLVIKILWVEPRGQGRYSPGSDTEVTDNEEPRSTSGFSKARRFVIIKVFSSHCICLPLLTYSGRGTGKARIKGHEHAAVFTGSKAVLAPGEAKNGLRPPLRVIPDRVEGELDPMTRLNYAKLYTVEYNVKVRFIGRVDPRSMPDLVKGYNITHQAVWEPSDEDHSRVYGSAVNSDFPSHTQDTPIFTSVNTNSTPAAYSTSSTRGQSYSQSSYISSYSDSRNRDYVISDDIGKDGDDAGDDGDTGRGGDEFHGIQSSTYMPPTSKHSSKFSRKTNLGTRTCTCGMGCTEGECLRGGPRMAPDRESKASYASYDHYEDIYDDDY